MVQEAFDFWRLRMPCLMGIVNVTPNSFSDGGKYFDADTAVARGKRLVEEGAEVLDLGAEASSFFRAGVTAVEGEEQLRRLRPVVRGLTEWRERAGMGFFLSVDTRSSVVAREMMGIGVEIVNDISAGEHDANMLGVVAEMGGSVVLMHIGRGYPETPKEDERDIVGTVMGYLRERVETAVEAGIPLRKIAVDPGVGFGKTMPDNWRLVARGAELSMLGMPVVLGGSRKRFLETPGATVEMVELARQLTDGRTVEHARDGISAAVTGVAARSGVQIHRVHEVALAREGIRMAGRDGK